MQEHMHMAQKCVDLLAPMIQHVVDGTWNEVKAISKEIYRFEQEADNIKNDIRNHLPKSLFMPVDRRDLLDILHSIDSIADTVEDVAASLQLKPLQLPTQLAESLIDLTARSIDTARQAGHIVDELDTIVQASFSGPEAEKVLCTAHA
jgi:predicted phosphate transport protein (TIGR00153 family)